MNKKHVISVAVILIVVGILAFYGGMQFANASKGNSGNFQFPGGQAGQSQRIRQGQGGRQFGGAQGGSMINGEILSVDAQSVTVKLTEGGSKIVFLSAATKISKTTDASIEDLKIGESLMVNGKGNTDGSMTAQMIQLRKKPAVVPEEKDATQSAQPGSN